MDVQEAGCVTFKPVGAMWVVHGTTLQLMLWNPYAWSPNPAFPAPPLGSRFCVVVDDGSCHLVPSPTPDELSVDVAAEVLGVDSRSLVLQPAAPPVHDAVFNGYPCSNVVVAFRGAPVTSPAFVAALFDCRPLMIGWDSFTTDDGRLLHEQVLDWFDTFCPDAWHAALPEVDVLHGVFMVAPGQVVQVVYMPDGPSSDGRGLMAMLPYIHPRICALISPTHYATVMSASTPKAVGHSLDPGKDFQAVQLLGKTNELSSFM